MLAELHIENFAIIDRLELVFAAGLITFTGETGAGKSIIIDAVETVLGGRVDINMIRAGSERASVEASFHLSEAVRPLVQAILEREELLEDPETLTLAREIRRSGRSVARVNGRSVAVGLLSELAAFLVDVHGQSEHLSLLHVRQHLGLLDLYANVSDLLIPYQRTYHHLHNVRRELNDLRQAESEAARRADILTYQINEIDAAHLRPDEEDGLRQERTRLANAEGLASLAQEAIQVLDEGTPESPAITDLFGQVTHSLHALVRLDPVQTSFGEQSELLLDNLTELTRDLRHYLEGIEFNPRRLEQVEERLNLIHNLKRKYGDSITKVLAFAEEARRQLDAITHAGERIAELEVEEQALLTQCGREGLALSQKRHDAAQKLEQALVTELADLSMASARFRVDFQVRPAPDGVLFEGDQRVSFDASGLERIEFLVAPNPGEGFKPLVKIASGGETSRLMLAIKNVLAHADQVPTLIFDEIDQGIGGRVGSVVGQKLWGLARQHQVLCVTHLPQLAAFGEQHFRVQKAIHEGRTLTQVEVLSGEPRLLELAQMMGGISDGTRRSARELLQAAAVKITAAVKTPAPETNAKGRPAPG